MFTLSLILSGCITGNVVRESDYIRIPVSEINSEMQKYTYNHNGVEIRYFAMLDFNGEIKVAFDACEVCGGRLGYTQQGNNVVCESCGLSFPVSNLGIENKGGGCWPSHLDHVVQGEHVLISEKDIQDGAFHFV